MYALVSIAGQQFQVEEGQDIFVHRLAANAGEEVSFDQVHLVSRDSGISIGTPTLSGHSVTAEVVDHLKGDKVIVFKKKRRKGYKVKNGHRQSFTKLKIKSING